MVIASIDIQNGKVVQLKQGAELILQRDNPLELAQEFDRYGEVAVIDLDAAMGKGSNIALIKPLLRKAECRVGGGIKTPEQAKELVSLGAQKIIVGSSAFRNSGAFGINVSFLEGIKNKIGRERLIVAVDARNGEIVVDGWKTPTGICLAEAARAVEPYASELLFTCVEREGTMTGIDFEQVNKLRESVNCKITVAGGISTVGEIEKIAALGCDVQLGMALYTGKISLAESFIASLNWKKAQYWEPGIGNQGELGTKGKPGIKADSQHDQVKNSDCHSSFSLLPIIVQSPDGQILMTGFTNSEALTETFKRGKVCFFSRTRNKLWMKGENSGYVLKLIRLRADCDRDALLAVAEPSGAICHTGAWSCFATGKNYTWELLQAIISERLNNPVPGSYTATLDDGLVREKILEEAHELCKAKTHDELVWETADLLYFTTVLMARTGVSVQEILDELDRRHKK